MWKKLSKYIYILNIDLDELENHKRLDKSVKTFSIVQNTTFWATKTEILGTHRHNWLTKLRSY